MRPLTIGIAGASGSGKTTVAETLIQRVIDEGYTAQIYDLDGCYRDLRHLPHEERSKMDFDDPSSLEIEIAVSQLRLLQQGRPVEKPVYDFATHTRRHDTDRREPTDLIVVEGIFALYFPGLRDVLDYKVYVQTDIGVSVARRFCRDQVERKRNPEDIKRQITRQVIPAYRRFIHPSREYSDIQVIWNDNTEQATRIILNDIRSRLDGMRGEDDA